MEELIKSTVKCYKKKTKKMVGGRRKTYEYNQYQVPLRKSDNLVCSQEVFVIPQSHFEELFEVESKALQEDLRQHKDIIVQYEKELADLEWKHAELSKSYKVLVSKNAKTKKMLKMEQEKTELYETLNTTLKAENRKLLNQLRELKEKYNILKETEEEASTKKDQGFLKSFRRPFRRDDRE